MQSAFMLVQLLERGSLLRRLAAARGRKVGDRFGSLKKLARRRRDSVRYGAGEDDGFARAEGLRIGLDPC